MTISAERKERLEHKLSKANISGGGIIEIGVSDLHALLHDSAHLERIERQVRELADSWEERPKHAQWCARELRAIVDTGGYK